MKLKQNLGEVANMFMGIAIGILICMGPAKQHFEDWDWIPASDG